MVRLIRRYPNRKLYDVQSSRYVSLRSLAEMLLSGDDLRVESSVDGKDLTRVTLARLKLAEAEAAVRSVPEVMAQRLGQGIDAVGQRLQRVETVLSSFRASLGHPLARVEAITEKLDVLQRSVDALNQRLDAIEDRVSEEE